MGSQPCFQLAAIGLYRIVRMSLDVVPRLPDQHIDDLPVLVDGAVNVSPHAVDLHVGLVVLPPLTRRMTGEPGGVSQQPSASSSSTSRYDKL
jgi:hypothetical protein